MQHNREWSAEDVMTATGGKTSGTWTARGVSIDSRKVQKGEVFVALKGEHFDGHSYVQGAFDAGAFAAIVSDVPQGFDAQDARLVLVKDTEVALQDLGVFARNKSAAHIVGVTGSVGKTGCKEMLRAALVPLGDVYATKGNLNNHLGVPLTLANMPHHIDYAVIEMGMNHAGEITDLSQWARPHVSVITTVDAVHIEFFNSVAEIADAKSEIFSGMGGEGVAVLNADNPHFLRMKEHAEKAGLDRILSFGTKDNALCQMINYGFDETGSQVIAEIAGTHVEYRMEAIGKHWGLMSVAVLGIVDALDGNVAKAAEALAHFDEPEGRGKIAKLPVEGGYLRLIDDSYNASPAAMEAAFEKLYMMKTQHGGRTVAVLGDMLELGDQSIELHLGLVPALVNNQVDLIFSAGEFMQYLFEQLPESMQGAYEPTSAKLAPNVVSNLHCDDIVLVKGSHGSAMHEVVDAIEEHSEQFALPLDEMDEGEPRAV